MRLGFCGLSGRKMKLHKSCGRALDMWFVLSSSSCCGVIWCFQHLEFWNLNDFFTSNWIICYFSKSCFGIMLMFYIPSNISQATVSSCPYFGVNKCDMKWNKHSLRSEKTPIPCSILLLTQCLELNRETYSGVRISFSVSTQQLHFLTAANLHIVTTSRPSISDLRLA